MPRFTIKQGCHYSDNRFFKLWLWKTKYSFLIDFDDSIIQYNEKETNKDDINKIVGVCFWSLKALWWSLMNFKAIHQYNSIRLGYVVREGLLDLFVYYYQNGTRFSEYITTVKAFGYFDFEIDTSDSLAITTLREKRTGIEYRKLASSYCTNTATMLFPYYGGDETAKSDFLINIDIT